MTPLVIFVLAWVGGELLAQAAHFPLVWLLVALPAALVLWVGWGEQPNVRRAVIVLIGLLAGAGRLALAQPRIDTGHIAFYNNAGRVAIEGVVVREPDRRPTLTNLHLDVQALILPDGGRVPLRGRVLVKAPPYNDIAYGDLIRATGWLESPPTFEDFSYRDYLARQGIHSLLRQADIEILASHQGFFLWEWLYRYKAHALKTLLTLLPEPQASLLAGILLGVESGIPDDLNAAFVATGTSHIVAISGFNLSIIAGIFIQMGGRLLKGRGKTLLPLVGLWLYTILVGASAAVLRAAVMATVMIIARREERATHGPTSLAAAVLVMALINPYVLWDVGFQLSLAATLGLILYTEPVTRGFQRLFESFTSPERAQHLIGWLSDALIVTIAAQITTIGVIVGVFHRLSLVTLLTNFLILPAQQYVMITGGIALIGGIILRPLGQLLGWLAWVFLTYTIEVVQWTATFPLASVELGHITLPLVWGYYLIVGLITWWYSHPVDERRRRLLALKTAATWQKITAVSAVILVMAYLYTAPDGRLHVFVLDAGQGDAIFIQTPHGKQALIDGGADMRQTLAQVGRCMPFWDRHLDMVILTAPAADRLTGLVPVLERYTVDAVYSGPETGQGNVYAQWETLLAARPAESVGTLWAGMALELDTDVTLHALWPEPGEYGPLVLQLTHGQTSFIFGGDATALVEEALVARDGSALRSSVLVLARHGAKSASTAAFLQAVAPDVAIISAGDAAPDPTVLARLMDTPVYRTAVDSTLEMTSDGQRIQVAAGRR
ncbi:MAG TPA: ComEC/Rec2 family competence protein [Anaerolineae bacterium]|nr:ComEC/Rec2 family competence protein [Anaerolineae bacterium]HQH38676.1 ComEC/Rec2 family competence protein [Anaerolineae bacterium]